MATIVQRATPTARVCAACLMTAWVCTGAAAAVYYVSNAGSDAAGGTSPDSAWLTIAEVNSRSFEAGDSILFRRGDTWREQLRISHSGSEGSPIVYSAYGTDTSRPRILGSERAEDWTAEPGYTNVWRSATILDAPRERTGNATTNHPASIFFGEADGSVTWGNMESLRLNGEGAPTDICRCDSTATRFEFMDAEYDWCWQEDHIYVYATENPGTRYAFVEVPQRVSTIRTSTHPPEEHIVIDSLELLFAIKYGYDDGWPMNVEVHGLTVTNCHIGWMGTKGAASAMGLQIWHSDMLVQNNDIHDCGRRTISYNVYGDVRGNGPVRFDNVVFDHNVLHSGYHTTGFDISAGYVDTFSNFVFSNNIVWDRPEDDPAAAPNDFTSMGFFMNADDALFTDFRVYNNIFRYTKQKGIAINAVTNTEIVNNTFCGMNERAGGGYRGMISVAGEVTNLRIANNVFYGNETPDFVLSCVSLSANSYAGTTLNNNLYFHELASNRMVNVDGVGSYRMTQWDTYLAETGWDADAPEPGDPLFSSAPLDLSLAEGSPAIGNAEPVSYVTTDMLGNPRDPVSPDIGALEYTGDAGVARAPATNLPRPGPVVDARPGGTLCVQVPGNNPVAVTVLTATGRVVYAAQRTHHARLWLAEGLYFVKIREPRWSAVKRVAVW